MQGVVGLFIKSLLQIYQGIFQWKSFIKRLRYDKFISHKFVSPLFLRHPVFRYRKNSQMSCLNDNKICRKWSEMMLSVREFHLSLQSFVDTISASRTCWRGHCRITEYADWPPILSVDRPIVYIAVCSALVVTIHFRWGGTIPQIAPPPGHKPQGHSHTLPQHCQCQTTHNGSHRVGSGAV